MDTFNEWKSEEERSKFLFFSQQAGGQLVSGNIKYSYFICQRDGTERLGNTRNRKTSMRHKKGKVKVGFHCPARIMVREDCISKNVHVQYISTHTHKVSLEDVRHHPISHFTQESIKQKLSLGIPAKLIHQSLTETFGKRGARLVNPIFSKEQLISLRSVKAAERRLKLSQRLHKDDATSLFMLIQKLRNESYDPILLYKPVGADTVVGDAEMQDLVDFENLFMLGIQTKEQRDRLLAGASTVLCIDATHGTNQYGFQLLNLNMFHSTR